MKKETKILFTAFFLLQPLKSKANEQSIKDSIMLNDVIVSTKATIIDQPQSTVIKKNEFGTEKNIPNIIKLQPSVVSYSEDGSGIGNTSLRIRGTDATRINVSLNGMPLNNPESQEVYWVNIPNLSNSLQSINVQRGIGSSSAGSSAFGACLVLK